MRVLVLGGTVFLGRHIVDALAARDHTITLFNRGQSNPGLFPELETITGDRTVDLSPLAGRTWDAIIDVAAYFPRVARMAALQIDAAHYTFISTLSVYSDFSRRGMDESALVGHVDDPQNEALEGGRYGPLKAGCERAVQKARPGAALIIRPGLIVGPHDPTDRFTYWVRRIAEGGDMLIPDEPSFAIQVIDARDLAEWIVRMVKQRTIGVFNATGDNSPARETRFVDLMEAGVQASGVTGMSPVEVTPAFLAKEGVQPWSDLPVWIGGAPEMGGFAYVDVSRAVEHGLTFRPLRETMADTLAWDHGRGAPPMRAGLTRNRERELIAKWRATG